jgi:hypothetical protein
VCVGVSSFTPSKEDGRTEGWYTALEALTNSIGLKIDDPLFGKRVRRAYTDSRQVAIAAIQTEDASEQAQTKVRDARRNVGEALVRSGGNAVPSQMADWYWEEYESRSHPGMSEFLVFVRIDVSPEASHALVKRYNVTVETLGAHALTTFPAMGWRYPEAAEGALIISVGPGVLQKLGLAEGDLVTRVRGQPVRDAEDFVAKVEADYASRKNNAGKMNMVVTKVDGAVIEYDRAPE